MPASAPVRPADTASVSCRPEPASGADWEVQIPCAQTPGGWVRIGTAPTSEQGSEFARRYTSHSPLRAGPRVIRADDAQAQRTRAVLTRDLDAAKATLRDAQAAMDAFERADAQRRRGQLTFC